MKEVGEQYYKRLLDARLQTCKAPCIPFFSTMTNEVIDKEGLLGAAYWRAHLESPVLFHTGMSKLLKTQTSPTKNLILLEIGPHSALAAPLRQTVHI